MTTLSPFLRKVIIVDAATGAVAAAAMIAGADHTHALFGLPSALLFWAGVATIPFVALLVWTLRSNSTALVPLIIGINFTWVAGSLYVAFAAGLGPTLAGQIFVCAQAAAVLILAELQVMSLRRGRRAA